MRFQGTALAAALAAACLAPALARGAGYGIYEQGAAALGMAGAATASVNDASANFFNPAALVRLQGNQFMVGGTWLSTRTSFAGTDAPGINPYPGYNVQESMKNGSFFPPLGYLSGHLGKRWAYGLGVNAPFGLGIEWNNPTTFTGREHATKASLQGFNAGLNLAWAAGETFSLAAGADEMFASVELNQIELSPPVPGGGGARVNAANVKLKSALRPGSGFNLAALWSPGPDLKFGTYYRSKVDVKITDGKATFTQIPTGNAEFDDSIRVHLPPNQSVSTTLHFPAIWSVGAAWTPTPDWTWEVDYNWTQWKAFDALNLDFAIDSPKIDTSLVENYGNSFRIGLGAEHRMPKLTYRFGYYYDKAAAPTESVTPLLPDASRHGATFGLGWKLGAKKAWSVDVYDLALFLENRNTEGKSRDHFDGVYKQFVNAAGIGIGYGW
jgi:long-chain fatty acid transport protein